MQVAGNLKYDVRTAVANALTESLRANLPTDAPAIICGSTLEGEERMLLDAWPTVLETEPRAVMVLAPRHPDRFAAVAGLVAERGFPVREGQRVPPTSVAGRSRECFLTGYHWRSCLDLFARDSGICGRKPDTFGRT